MNAHRRSQPKGTPSIKSLVTTLAQPAPLSQDTVPLTRSISLRDSSPSPDVVEPARGTVAVTPESPNIPVTGAPFLDRHTVHTMPSHPPALRVEAALTSNEVAPESVNPTVPRSTRAHWVRPKLVPELPSVPSSSGQDGAILISATTGPATTNREASWTSPGPGGSPPVRTQSAAERATTGPVTTNREASWTSPDPVGSPPVRTQSAARARDDEALQLRIAKLLGRLPDPVGSPSVPTQSAAERATTRPCNYESWRSSLDVSRPGWLSVCTDSERGRALATTGPVTTNREASWTSPDPVWLSVCTDSERGRARDD